MIRIQSVSKAFFSGDETVEVLSGASLTLPNGAFYAVVWPSGSGKSTLLNLASGLILPDSGSVFFDDTDIALLDEDARTRFRGKNIAFVFQQFHLVANLTVEENVELTLELNGLKRRFDTEVILERVGLLGKEHRYPFELSGGEQQRVAIARAFVGEVPYLFMDEPTGNLDKKNADRVMDLIGELRRETEISILAITHDDSVAERADKRFRVEEKRVV